MSTPCRIPYENASRTGVRTLPNGSNLFVAMHVIKAWIIMIKDQGRS